MPPSPEKSELARAFERLFSEMFNCDWREYLQDEYHVHVDGKNYFIDYVYIGQGRKIGIEVDGHGKIKGATDSTRKFHDLLARQNDLIGQGFEVYRFGWHHVVSMGGWVARHQLKRIFWGLIQPTPPQQRSSLPVPWRPTPPVLGQASYSYHHTQPMLPMLLRAVGLGLAFAAVIFVVAKVAAPKPQAELTSTPVVQAPVEPSATPTQATNPTPRPPQPTVKTIVQPVVQPVVQRTVYVQAPASSSKPVVKAVPPQPVDVAHPHQAPKTPPHLQNTPTDTSGPTPVVAVQSPPPATAIDEIVAFNQNSHIYHQLHCTWAKRCRNCISIPQSQAIQLGGRPAKTCDPR
jgi:hypothetical protein